MTNIDATRSEEMKKGELTTEMNTENAIREEAAKDAQTNEAAEERNVITAPKREDGFRVSGLFIVSGLIRLSIGIYRKNAQDQVLEPEDRS